MDDVVQMTYVDAVAYLEKNGFDAPDPADYGVWVPGIPVLVGDGLDAANAAPWLSGLINDGIVAGVGAVLGFVPQMLVLFLMLAFLEACGYMARIAFVLDRVFRKFGLSGKSFIPMLIGVGCGVPGVMASRTIENERDRRMTIMTTTFIPCGAKVPFIAMIAGALFGGSAWVSTSAYFIGMAAIICSGIMLKKTKALCRRPCSLRYGASGIPHAHPRQRSPLHVGARLVLHQEGRYHHPALDHLRMVHHLLRLGRRLVPDALRGSDRLLHPCQDRQRHRLDLQPARLGQLAGNRRIHHRPCRKGEHRRHSRHPLRRRRRHRLPEHRSSLHRHNRLTPSSCSTSCVLPALQLSARSSAR